MPRPWPRRASRSDQVVGAERPRGGGRRGSLRRPQTRLDQVARQAADFQALVTRVETRCAEAAGPGRSAASSPSQRSRTAEGDSPLSKGSLLPPVAGTMVPAGRARKAQESRALPIATLAGAQVIAPADGKVLFAGPYHKSGQVLILEITTGYDLVLAGLGRVSVRPNDELLAGEPVGTMPQAASRVAG